MAEVTVKQFAEVVGISVDRLLEQLKEAGVSVTNADATISDDEKMTLLGFLRNKHTSEEKTATEPKKITLKRKSTSELKTTNAQGRAKAVTVEVRKKRTYVKRSVVMEQEQEQLEKAREEQARIEAEQQEREHEAKRKIEEQEAKRRAEEEALEKAKGEAKKAEEQQ